MRSNIKLGKVSGIEIGLHYSWFIIAARIVFSLVERFRAVHADWTRGEIWTVALVRLPAYQQLLYHASKVAEGSV